MSLPAEEVLLRWVNHQLKKSPHQSQVRNFSTDLAVIYCCYFLFQFILFFYLWLRSDVPQDGTAITALVKQVTEADIPTGGDATERVNALLAHLRPLSCAFFLRPADTTNVLSLSLSR